MTGTTCECRAPKPYVKECWKECCLDVRYGDRGPHDVTLCKACELPVNRGSFRTPPGPYDRT